MSDELDFSRLFVRPVGPDAIKEDLDDLFKSFGPIVEVKLMRGYGFVQFAKEEDAKAARDSLQASDFRGSTLQIEFAKPKPTESERDEYNNRMRAKFDRGGDRDRYGGNSYSNSSGGRRYRVLVTNLGEDASWQDLKDFARENNINGVQYADVSRTNDGSGVIDFISKQDMDDGIEKLSGLDYKGNTVEANEDPNPPPMPNFSSGPPRYRDNFSRGGRGGFDRRGGGYGRDRYDDRDRYDRRDRYDHRDRYDDRDRRYDSRRDDGRRGGRDYDRRGDSRRDYDRRDRDRDYDRRDRDRDYDRRDRERGGEVERERSRSRSVERRDSRNDDRYARERSNSPPRYNGRDREEEPRGEDNEEGGSW